MTKKTYSKKIEINFNVNIENLPDGLSIDDYKDAIDEDAKERVFNMINDGYLSGELNIDVKLGLDGEPENGIQFLGYWDSNTIITSVDD